MKTHKSAGAFAITSFILIAACSANNSAALATFQTGPVTKISKPAKTFNCHNANEYTLVEVVNPERKKDSDPAIPKDLHIVAGNVVISKIELPKESEVNNFSLNSITKDRAGFKIEVDWGGGVNHYEIQFNFRCSRNRFYLYRVRKVSFSTTNPDSGNFLDKKKSKVTKIVPNLPVEKFVMTDYL